MNKHANALLLLAGALASIAVAVHAGIRLRDTAAVRERLAVLERTAAQTAEAGADIELLRKLFPARTDISSFVENLAVLAQRAGLRDLEIATLQTAGGKPARPPQRGQAGAAPPVVFHALRFSFEGNYRSVAEYLRSVQNVERFKRITLIEMRPSKQTIRTSLIVEIAEFEAGHDS